ncbi:hypothetical protein, partial [Vibrio genomosp. F10]|uniref:hypothetical protein n=1 Tax=Vibrio genomosp. F10 TaxID=723171 RepID=UPI0003659E29
EFTSIQARLEGLNNQQETAPCLHPFIGNPANEKPNGIPFRLMDYIELVDWTARQFRESKASLERRMPPILQRLNVNQRHWLKACTELERHRSTAVGCICTIEPARSSLNKKRIHLFRLDG